MSASAESAKPILELHGAKTGNCHRAAIGLSEAGLLYIAGSERFLVDNEFVGGASFSIADIAAFTIISAVSRHVPWNQLPRLAAWRDRIGHRPAVQTGMTAFDVKRETVN
jgi:hypothetical protein